MSETRKLAAILVADVVGYSRLAGADEDRILARLRTLRSDLIDPIISVHHGRIVKRTGDGSIIEFRSVVDAVRCAIEVQTGMVERNAGLPPERRIEFRIGIHLGDVVEEADGDLMGDGVNVAARLEGVAKPGAICLSEDAYRQVKGRLGLRVSDLGPTQLKNIVEPIRVYLLEVGQGTDEMRAPAPEKPGPPPHLSIVVLPFTNLTGDPGQDYFVDGVTESLTTDLSRIRGSFVIGRNTAFTYKRNPVDLKQIGRELNVRYILEGSVQRSSSRMRVGVQLIDAENGHHLWADRFDKPLADLFDLQDEIVSRIASALYSQLYAAEARRAERALNPDAMDFVFQGMAWHNKGVTAENMAEARRLFERALALDPANVGGLVGVAAVDLQLALAILVEDRTASLGAAEVSLNRALMIAPDNAMAHVLLGAVEIYTNRAADGIRHCERALELNRNLAGAHAQIGTGKLFLGHAEDTEAHIHEALRLSPRDPLVYLWYALAGMANLSLDKNEEAVAWLRRSLGANQNFAMSHFLLAAAFAHLGQLDEARREVRAGLAVNPNFTIKRYRVHVQSDNAVHLAHRERFVEGMRLAGAPEE